MIRTSSFRRPMLTAEWTNVEAWSQINNLTLNRGKSLEIIFTDKRRKRSFQLPPPLTNIDRVDAIKILGVSISNALSVRKHVDNVISSCAQTVHALRIGLLSAHDMAISSLQIVFKSVVVAKLSYAASSCMVGIRDGRRSTTTTSRHPPRHLIRTMRS